jgi:hypothetical protein
MAACSHTVTTPAPPIAHLAKQGTATQLIVDGKPFLVLAGEVTNTIASSPEQMKTVWPHLAKVHLNTVLAAIAWAWVEPQEGKYDFTIADNFLRDARIHNMRVVWFWFEVGRTVIPVSLPLGSKRRKTGFPRAQIRGGRTVEVL